MQTIQIKNQDQNFIANILKKLIFRFKNYRDKVCRLNEIQDKPEKLKIVRSLTSH